MVVCAIAGNLSEGASRAEVSSKICERLTEECAKYSLYTGAEQVLQTQGATFKLHLNFAIKPSKHLPMPGT